MAGGSATNLLWCTVKVVSSKCMQVADSALNSCFSTLDSAKRSWKVVSGSFSTRDSVKVLSWPDLFSVIWTQLLFLFSWCHFKQIYNRESGWKRFSGQCVSVGFSTPVPPMSTTTTTFIFLFWRGDSLVGLARANSLLNCIKDDSDARARLDRRLGREIGNGGR